MNTKVNLERDLQIRRKVIENRRKKKQKMMLRRLILKLVIFALFMSGTVTVFADYTSNDIPVNYDGEYYTYSVSKGDRLWDIAEKSSENRDVREVVYIIEKDNNLNDANLHIGQELKLRNNY